MKHRKIQALLEINEARDTSVFIFLWLPQSSVKSDNYVKLSLMLRSEGYPLLWERQSSALSLLGKVPSNSYISTNSQNLLPSFRLFYKEREKKKRQFVTFHFLNTKFPVLNLEHHPESTLEKGNYNFTTQTVPQSNSIPRISCQLYLILTSRRKVLCKEIGSTSPQTVFYMEYFSSKQFSF